MVVTRLRRDAPAAPARSRVAAWVWTVVPPLVALVAARLVTVARSPVGWTSLDPAAWARWDSGHYLTIAAEGYHYGDCAALGLGEADQLCQNVAWYPLLPTLMRVAGWFGVDRADAGVALATAAWAATVVLAWVWFLGDRPAERALPALVLVACFPGAVYLQALFPVSLLGLAVLVWLRAMGQGRWTLGAVAAAVGSTAYPVGIVLVPATVLWAAGAGRSAAPAERARRGLVAGGLSAAGTLVVFAWHQLDVGSWRASLDAQRALGSHLMNPFRSLWSVVVQHDSWIQALPGNDDLARATAWQTAVVAVLVVATVATALAAWRREGLDVGELAALVAMVGSWLLPLASFIDTGLYRREATLLPFAVLAARRLPPWLLVGLAGASVIALAQLSPHFFDMSLV